jgi:hypothetical protein
VRQDFDRVICSQPPPVGVGFAILFFTEGIVAFRDLSFEGPLLDA